MRIRISSDRHFWHQMLIDKGFRKKDFQRKLLNQLKNISPEDLLICLWDVLIGNDAAIHANIMPQIKCKKILIMWNHDRKKAMWYMTHWRDFACHWHTICLDTKRIILSHQPLKAWDLPEWWYNIHGHRHDRPLPAYSDKHLLYSPELENYKPKELSTFFT